MVLTLLSALIFVAVFAGVVLIHEFGHMVVAKLLKVEVEEFGVGLPPRILTFWRQKGFLLLRSGRRIVIPRNFQIPYVWSSVLNHASKITVDQVDDRLILRTLEMTDFKPGEQGLADDPLKSIEVLIDKTGQAVQPERPSGKGLSEQVIKFVKSSGGLELTDVISEVHPGTEFTLNWLPIGGFVRPKGENDPHIPGGLAAARPWVRLAVLFAGPTMNLLGAVVVFSLLFFQMGVPDYSKVQIDDVVAGSPAAQAGFQLNDIVLTAGGQTITDPTQLHDVIYANLDKPIAFTVQRGKQTVNLTATPLSSRPQGQGALGISMGPALVRSGSLIDSLHYGSYAVYVQSRLLVSLPAQMLRGQVSPQDGRFIGLKGIYDLFGQAVSRDVQSREQPTTFPSSPATPPTPTFFTLQLIGILTVSIGILNLMPFPALDGGRIFFVLIELVIRRRVPQQFETVVHGIGMALLILFMIYINVMDFVNPASINLP